MREGMRGRRKLPKREGKGGGVDIAVEGAAGFLGVVRELA